MVMPITVSSKGMFYKIVKKELECKNNEVRNKES